MPSISIQQPSFATSFKVIFVRYSLLITLALVTVLIAASYFLVIKPKMQVIGEGSGNDIKMLRIEKIKREAYLAQLQEISKRYRAFDQAELVKLNQILPEEADIPNLFVQLQNLAMENNLILSNVGFNETAPENGAAKNGIRKLSIGMNLQGSGQGSYDQLKSFINSLENNLRLFDIQAVYFTPGSPNYSLTLITYYLAQ